MCNVDLSSGRLSLTALDFEIPGRIPLVLRRHYRSTNLWLGDLGYGWGHPFGVRLWLQDDMLWFRGEDGRRIPFARPTVGMPTVQPTEKASLHLFQPPDLPWPALRSDLKAGAFVLQIRECFTRIFDTRPIGGVYPLRALADRYENMVQIVPGTDALPRELRDPHGRVLYFHRNRSGLLAEVRLAETGASGTPTSLVKYDYDLSKNLIAAQDAAGVRTYEYSEHVLVRHRDRCGTTCQSEFDGQGRCIRTSGPNRIRERTYEYDPEAKTTRTRDSLDGTLTSVYSENTQVVQNIDRAGGVSKFDYDAHNRLVRTTDQMGYETTICFDAAGSQVGKVRADGTASGITTNARGEVIRITTASGASTEYERDEAGRITKLKIPGEGVYGLSYSSSGDIEKIAMPAGKEVSIQWSSDRRLLKESDQDGLLNECRFDVFGRLIQWQDAVGAVWKYVYDGKGHLSKIINPDLTSRRFNFDAEGHLTELQDEAGGLMRWKYDSAGRRIECSVPAAGTVRCEFDTENRVTGILSPDGLWHRYQYDVRGLVIAQQFCDGRVERYGYDGRGLLVRMTNPDETVIEIERDAVGRPVLIRYPEGSAKTVQYDEDGRWIRKEYAGHVLERELTPDGQTLKEQADGYLLQREYDEAGNILSILDGLGRKVLYGYDEDGRVVSTTILQGRWYEESWTEMLPPRTHRFEYDRVGNMIRWEMPSGKVETRAYDLRRHLVDQTIVYDSRVILKRTYSYDALGRLAAVRDSRRGNKSFTYDPLNRLQSFREDNRTVQDFRYDAAGDLLFNRMRYLAGHRPSATQDYRLEYDKNGFLVRRTSRRGREDFRYTVYGLLKEVAASSGSRVQYEYDPHSRLVRKRTGDSEWRFFWNVDKLWAMREGQGQATEFLYLPELQPPIEQVQVGKYYSLHTDPLGKVEELIDDDGNVVWTNPQGVWGEGRGTPVSRGGSPECLFGFPGQVWDPHSGFFYNRFRYYFPETAHFVTPDPIGIWGGLDNFRYVPDPVNQSDPLGLECRNKTDDPALYRGDRRPPETICNDGFVARNPAGTRTLAQHVGGKTHNSQWISTSYNRDMAHHASAFGTDHDADIGPRAGRWVYEIENPGCGVEVDCDPGVIAAAEEKKKKFNITEESEQEIAFNKAIPPSKIAGYYNLDTGEHGTC